MVNFLLCVVFNIHGLDFKKCDPLLLFKKFKFFKNKLLVTNMDILQFFSVQFNLLINDDTPRILIKCILIKVFHL